MAPKTPWKPRAATGIKTPSMYTNALLRKHGMDADGCHHLAEAGLHERQSFCAWLRSRI